MMMMICLIRPDLFGRKKVLLIFGGRSDDHDEHDNLTGVDSTPVNCGEENGPSVGRLSGFVESELASEYRWFLEVIVKCILLAFVHAMI